MSELSQEQEQRESNKAKLDEYFKKTHEMIRELKTTIDKGATDQEKRELYEAAMKHMLRYRAVFEVYMSKFLTHEELKKWVDDLQESNYFI